MQKALAEYNQYLHLEKVYWKQKARYEWFENSAKNTRFFHNLVKGIRQKLKVSRIENSQGNWLEEETEIKDEVVDFFLK